MLVEPPQIEQDNYKYLMKLEDEITDNLYDGMNRFYFKLARLEI